MALPFIRYLVIYPQYKWLVISTLLNATLILSGCFPLVGTRPNQQAPQTPTPTLSPCLHGTPEPLWVDPVTSPTDQLTQVITVYIGYGEEVTIKTESGTFTVTGGFDYPSNPAKVEISLLPNTVHHLEVTAKVRETLSIYGDCVYGGYILRTVNDRNGNPLMIVHGQATP
jgi:hypothetical protein